MDANRSLGEAEMKIKASFWKVVWSLFSLVTLAGCGSLKGLGDGLQNIFKGFHVP